MPTVSSAIFLSNDPGISGESFFGGGEGGDQYCSSEMLVAVHFMTSVFLSVGIKVENLLMKKTRKRSVNTT